MMFDEEEHARIQRVFDELALQYDTDEAQRHLAQERRRNLQPLVSEHQRFLARSWQVASGKRTSRPLIQIFGKDPNDY